MSHKGSKHASILVALRRIPCHTDVLAILFLLPCASTLHRAQIPGGYLASRVGGKAVLTASFLLWAPASALMALPANGSDHVVAGIAACRLSIGIAQGLLLPAAHSVLGHWIPWTHRGRHFAFAMSGMYAGNAAAMVAIPSVGERGFVPGRPTPTRLKLSSRSNARASKAKLGGPLARRKLGEGFTERHSADHRLQSVEEEIRFELLE